LSTLEEQWLRDQAHLGFDCFVLVLAIFVGSVLIAQDGVIVCREDLSL